MTLNVRLLTVRLNAVLSSEKRYGASAALTLREGVCGPCTRTSKTASEHCKYSRLQAKRSATHGLLRVLCGDERLADAALVPD